MTDDAPTTDDSAGPTETNGASEADGAGLDPADQRAAVRERYGRIATESPPADRASSACCTDAGDGCGAATERSRAVGYADDDLAAVEPGANLGLGCGNPTAIASLEPGEDVLDLGAGAGFDCFLAAREVGSSGHVVGVDTTPEMVERARENADENDAANVEFRLGEIEHLPVADESVDAILSNCVVNLSPDKPRVFREAFRVLRPDGRLAISDVVLTAEPPAGLRADPDSVAACVAGASPIPALESMLDDAGFVDVSIEPEADSEAIVGEWDDAHDLSDFVVSATIEGTKPAP